MPFVKPGRLSDLSGDIAVVIGATGVLGGELAEGLALAGSKVAVLGRNVPRGEARTKHILNLGAQAAFFAIDATRKESLSGAHQAVAKSLGPPSILIIAISANPPN